MSSISSSSSLQSANSSSYALRATYDVTQTSVQFKTKVQELYDNPGKFGLQIEEPLDVRVFKVRRDPVPVHYLSIVGNEDDVNQFKNALVQELDVVVELRENSRVNKSRVKGKFKRNRSRDAIHVGGSSGEKSIESNWSASIERVLDHLLQQKIVVKVRKALMQNNHLTEKEKWEYWSQSNLQDYIKIHLSEFSDDELAYYVRLRLA